MDRQSPTANCGRPEGPTSRNRALLAWYHRNRRDLPWRRDRDPWRILISEVMLQQTQATRVAPVFERFIARFPTVEDAAAVTPDVVVSAWVGLGYNARARRLHAAARRIAADGWPRTAEELRSLPGVGQYTAAAVASIAFGERVAAVDTNLRRVLSRWVGRALSGAGLEEVAAQNVAADAATWNQAVMDLGAVLCRPRQPGCDACPVASWCVDPTVYVAPPRQATFAGSDRQVRGAVVRTLAGRSWSTPDEIAAATGHRRDRVSKTADRMVTEGLLEAHEGGVRLSRIG
ncbi:MAG: A/G-specific adenine glycosylase [Actinomycetota bacterium]